MYANINTENVNMNIDERFEALGKRITDLEERLYAREILQRRVAPPPDYPTTQATNIEVKANLVGNTDLGADISFTYPCVCGTTHHAKVEHVKGLLYNTVRTHTTHCEKLDQIIKVVIHIPRNPDRILLEEATAELMS